MINHTVDDPRLGPTLRVDKMIDGEKGTVHNKDETNSKIQLVTEK